MHIHPEAACRSTRRFQVFQKTGSTCRMGEVAGERRIARFGSQAKRVMAVEPPDKGDDYLLDWHRWIVSIKVAVLCCLAEAVAHSGSRGDLCWVDRARTVKTWLKADAKSLILYHIYASKNGGITWVDPLQAKPPRP